jgi:hypothetical protein
MNRATRIIVTVVGIMLAIAGLDHGFFETLQGSKPTTGLIIQAIGPEMNLWGTEEAFTVIPNFLVTGLLAIAVSLAIIVWSLRYLDTQHGATVFGLLFIALFLVGGGIAAQIVFVPFAWAAARQINKPLDGWRRLLPEPAGCWLAKIWPVTLALGTLSLLIGLFIAITGYVPGVRDDESILAVCWAFVFGGGWGLYLLTYVSGFVYDARQRIALIG